MPRTYLHISLKNKSNDDIEITTYEDENGTTVIESFSPSDKNMLNSDDLVKNTKYYLLFSIDNKRVLNLWDLKTLEVKEQNDISKHAVEQGQDITHAIAAKAVEVSITGFIPYSYIHNDGRYDYGKMVSSIRKYSRNGDIFEVSLKSRTMITSFKNMVIKDFSFSAIDVNDDVEFKMSLEEVKFVSILPENLNEFSPVINITGGSSIPETPDTSISTVK